MKPRFTLPAAHLNDLAERALAEDLGSGDLTTRLLFPGPVPAEAVIRMNQDAVVAGLPVVQAVFRKVDPRLQFTPAVEDGDRTPPGTVIVRLRGDGRSMLKAERVALNFLQHLSGIATLTSRFVKAVRGTKAVIRDTRKTTPGLRLLEKYAVRAGGGRNHRMNLEDGILIKDNHSALAGGLPRAFDRGKRGTPRGLRVEVEAARLEEVDEALASGADFILLDNMSVPDLKEAVRRIGGRARTEASGGIHLGNVRAVAETGVDFISIGALTHSAPAVDSSMDIIPARSK